MNGSKERQIANAIGAPYTRIIHRDEGTWSGRVLELPGVFGGGDTPEEVMESLDEAIAIWVGDQIEREHDIPQPFEPGRFSGQFSLRIPPALHADAAEFARLQSVSLNRLFSAAIAYYLGRHSVLGPAFSDRATAEFVPVLAEPWEGRWWPPTAHASWSVERAPLMIAAGEPVVYESEGD